MLLLSFNIKLYSFLCCLEFFCYICTALYNICNYICQCASDIRIVCATVKCRNFTCIIYDVCINFLSAVEIGCFLIYIRFSCRKVTCDRTCVYKKIIIEFYASTECGFDEIISKVRILAVR